MHWADTIFLCKVTGTVHVREMAYGLASVKEKMKVFSMVQVYLKYKILVQYMIYSSQNLENQKKKNLENPLMLCAIIFQCQV